jgi:hypothetical protein
MGCGSDDAQTHDAGLDAIKRLAVTVDGPATLQQNTRSVKVIITANGTTRMDTFPVAGLPSTVDVPAPIQLSNWAIQVDGLDIGGTVIGRGTTTVPAGTSEAMVILAPP